MDANYESDVEIIVNCNGSKEYETSKNLVELASKLVLYCIKS